MPEYPDITVYIEKLQSLIVGRNVEKINLISPFFLRTVDPPISAIEGAEVVGLRRLGKRIVFVFADELFLPCFKAQPRNAQGAARVRQSQQECSVSQ